MLTLLLLGIGCWLLKVLFVAVVPAERLPDRLRAALDHLPPAVLAALVVSSAATAVRGDAARTVAVAVAALVVVGLVHRRGRRLLVAIGIACAAVVLVDLVLTPMTHA